VLVANDRSDWQLMGAKGIRSIDDLRGKIVGGYGPQTSISTVLVELLRRRGLEPDSYILRDVGVARAAALANDQVAATLLNSSEWIPLMKEGYPALAYAGAEVEMPQTGLATSTALLQNRREFVQRVVAAVLESIAAASSQKEVTVSVMAQQFGVSPEDAATVFDLLQSGWRPTGQPSLASLQFELETDQRDLELLEPVRPEQIYDFSLIDGLTAGGKAGKTRVEESEMADVQRVRVHRMASSCDARAMETGEQVGDEFQDAVFVTILRWAERSKRIYADVA
jgi:ABC-type nitrate/sulfonate/bicarbonate transport system substrate-binding protein